MTTFSKNTSDIFQGPRRAHIYNTGTSNGSFWLYYLSWQILLFSWWRIAWHPLIMTLRTNNLEKQFTNPHFKLNEKSSKRNYKPMHILQAFPLTKNFVIPGIIICDNAWADHQPQLQEICVRDLIIILFLTNYVQYQCHYFSRVKH